MWQKCLSDAGVHHITWRGMGSYQLGREVSRGIGALAVRPAPSRFTVRTLESLIFGEKHAKCQYVLHIKPKIVKHFPGNGPVLVIQLYRDPRLMRGSHSVRALSLAREAA